MRRRYVVGLVVAFPLGMLSVLAPSLALQTLGSAATLFVGSSDDWRDKCAEVQWNKQDSGDYFTEDAWDCKLDDGRWTTVYEFTPGTDIDGLIELGHSFDTKIEVVDRDGDWVMYYHPDEQEGPVDPCRVEGIQPPKCAH